MMVNGEFPPQGLLDYLTRSDELLVENIKAIRALTQALSQGLALPMGSAGPNVQGSLLPVATRTDLRQQLETGQLQAYKVLSFDMTTGATDREVIEIGQSLVAGTDGVLDGCFVRFHSPVNDRSPLKYFDWAIPFTRFYVTWPSQPGKTLYLAVGKEALGRPQAPTAALANAIGTTQRANEHNLAIVASTPFLAAALTPLSPAAVFRVQVAVDTAGRFQALVTRGGNTQTVDFNSGNDLLAGALYVFDMLVHDGDSVNFQHTANATLQVFRVQEVSGG